MQLFSGYPRLVLKEPSSCLSRFSAREGGAGGNDVAANNLTEIYWGNEKVSTITASSKDGRPMNLISRNRR